MICDGCKPPHKATDCVDVIAGREYPHRVCACQHKPRQRHTANQPASSTVDADDETSASDEQ